MNKALPIFIKQAENALDRLFLLSVLLASLIFPAFAQEQIPDYNNPYAPIIFDKQVYTWTDKVRITIIAPSWNENTNGIDSIGDQEGRHIKISTGGHSLEPYKLTETEPNSGIFRGEVTLTGFLHDVNGDSKTDTNPRTSGNGPTNGFLETQRDSGLTLTFEFADGVILTKSALISWNEGKTEFDADHYFSDSTAKITVTDPDMNLNPEVVDTVEVEITSDSDAAGIKISASETSDSSGVFVGKFQFSETLQSSGNRLFAVPSDVIYAKYKDTTLPPPYSIDDSLDIIAQSNFESPIPLLDRVGLSEVYVSDRSGNPIQEVRINESFQIVGTVHNNQNFEQPFVYIIQIKDSTGVAVELSWITGELAANQTLQVSQSWRPDLPDEYSIETYVWNSLTDTLPLAPSLSISRSVQ